MSKYEVYIVRLKSLIGHEDWEIIGVFEREDIARVAARKAEIKAMICNVEISKWVVE